MKRVFTILLVLFYFFGANAQIVKNVHARINNEQVIITYDLSSNKEGENKFYIELSLSTNGGNTYNTLITDLTGDIGENIEVGRNKQIVWYPFRSNPDYVVEKAKFKVKVFGFENYTETTAGLNLQMIAVKGGTFRMGSNSGNSNEKPVHSVTVSDFYIGKYEVTQAQWKAVMGNNPSYFKGDNLPVESISWYDVQEFIKKLNQRTGKHYRLPTEAEWEYAARGGNKSRGYKYSGSDNIESVAWYIGNSSSKTHIVGTKQHNELEIYDMSGNVWEWCNDCYSSSYYGSGPQNNPQGASSGSRRVRRGGSWGNGASSCRVANRNYNNPNYSLCNLGFRLAIIP